MYHLAKQYKNINILIIKPSSLGDIIHTLPLLYAIRKYFSEASISWMVKKEFAPILEMSPFIDNVIPISFSFGGIPQIVKNLRGVKKKGKTEKFDFAIDIQCLLRSALLTCNSRNRIGFSNGRELSPLFYNIKVDTESVHAVDRYMDVTQKLGCYTQKRDFSLITSSKTKEKVDELFRENNIDISKEKFVAVNPNARWITKRWPLNKYQELINLLGKAGFSVIVTGAKSDKEYTDNLNMPTNVGSKAINLTGKLNIQELVELLRRVSLFITNDSGPMHIAAAVKTPIIALFGATDSAKTGPYSDNSIVIKSKKNCSPCFKRECSQNMECFEEIKVVDVFNSTVKYLGY